MNKRSFSHPGSIENGSIDTEFTPILHATDGKFCAADERFASVNEAIGLLQYNAEQDSERIDDLLVRVEKLEAAQPVMTVSQWPQLQTLTPMQDGYAHIPLAEWEDIKAELEDLRAKWNSVPWDEITRATWQLELGSELRTTLEQWIIANVEQNHAPEEEADNG